MAGVDFIVNVTLDNSFRVTGVFAGDLELAHAAAAAKVRSYVGLPMDSGYDIVVTHAGFVGVNHYQAAKAAVAALGAVRAGGHLILVADNSDTAEPVGSLAYRSCLQLLCLMGPEAFARLLRSPDWTFLPDQWQVQQWAKVFARVPMRNFVYFAPQLDDRHWAGLPGVDGRCFLAPGRKEGLADAPEVVERAIASIVEEARAAGRRDLSIAYLADGPYGIPIGLEG